MADTKNTESPGQDTNTTRFPEVTGKTVESIELTSTADYYGINVNFTDNTAMIFNIESFAVTLPYLGDWKTGEQKILKEYEPVRSVSLKT